ncbi:hypothetical protein Hanom_Chr03g00208431 [Helianthus anomalus]
MGEAVTVTEEAPYYLADTSYLISFQEEDLDVLSRNQIRTNEKYEICAKSWTSAVANVIGAKL